MHACCYAYLLMGLLLKSADCRFLQNLMFSGKLDRSAFTHTLARNLISTFTFTVTYRYVTSHHITATVAYLPLRLHGLLTIATNVQLNERHQVTDVVWQPADFVVA